MAYSHADDSSDSSDDDETSTGPSWMNKFAVAPTAVHSQPGNPAVATNITAGPNTAFAEKKSGEPEWMQKFGVNNRNNSLADSSTSLSSSTHSYRMEETPAWINNKFQKPTNRPTGMNGSHHKQTAPPSPGRAPPPPPTTTTTAPSPSWMNRKAGAPSIQSAPTHNPSNESGTTPPTPAWRKSALNDSNSSMSSAASATRHGASETPSWMNKFEMKRQSNNEIPTISNHSVASHDGDKSISSVQSYANNVEPEWMNKFSKKKMTPSLPSSDKPVATAAIPTNKTSSGGEPEWMARFKQIGMTQENAAMKTRSTVTNGNFLSTINGQKSIGVTPPRGMSSAPSSPSTSRKIAPLGMMSAPSSPVAAPGQPKFSHYAGAGGHTQRRQSLGSADTPAFKDSDEKPAWMRKLLVKKHEHELPEEKQRSNTTPPWKLRERLREEQAEKLRVSLGLDLGVEEGQEEGDDDGQGSWASAGDFSAEKEASPEWMQQFKKMDLRAARVVSAQGRAPQTVALLRMGSTKTMTERTGEIVDDSEVIKAISVRTHSSRSLMSRHASFRSSKTNTDMSKHSRHSTKTSDDNASQGSFSEQQDQVVAIPSGSSMTRELLKPAGGPPTRKASEFSALTQSTAKSGSTDDDKSGQTNMDYQSVHSSATISFSSQAEIDNSVPQNVMGMWGDKVKAKKPGNSTLMSWRMIQNQNAKVKERIDRAKNGESSKEEVAEDSGGVKQAFDESATALFFAGTDKKGDKKADSFSMENSAAALFGFGGGKDMSKASDSVNMENSAAALFGFGASSQAQAPGQTDSKSEDLFPSSNSENVDNVSGQQSLSNFFADSRSDFGTHECTPDKTDAEKNTAGGSNNEDEETKGERAPLSSFEPSSFATTAAVVAPAATQITKPPTRKKSFLDDSDSDDSDSDSDRDGESERKPEKVMSPSLTKAATPDPETKPQSPPKKKKSWLDDSDSDSDDDDSSSDDSSKGPSLSKGKPYKPPKTESTLSTIPLVALKNETKEVVEIPKSSSLEDPLALDIETKGDDAIKDADTPDAACDFPSDIFKAKDSTFPSPDPFDGAAISKETHDFSASDAFEKSDPFGNDDSFGKSFEEPVSVFSSESQSKQEAVPATDTKSKEDNSRMDVKNATVGATKSKRDPYATIAQDSTPREKAEKKKIDPAPINDDWQTGFSGPDTEDVAKKEERDQWQAALMELNTAAKDKGKTKNIESSKKKDKSLKKDNNKSLPSTPGSKKKSLSKDKKGKDPESDLKTPKSQRKKDSDNKKSDASPKKEKKKNDLTSPNGKKKKSAKSDLKPPKSPRKGKGADSKKKDDSKRSRDRTASRSMPRGNDGSKTSKLLIVPSKAKQAALPSKPKSSKLVIKPKSSTKLTPTKPKSLVIKPKSKASLTPTKPKSIKVVADDFDDDGSFVMNDFDDDFSTAMGFGDFAEDGSVLPLKAVRNHPKRSGKRSKAVNNKKKTKNGVKSGSKKSKDKKSDKKKLSKKRR